MPLSHRLYIGDEELAKKYDDHRPRQRNTRYTRQYQKMYAPQRRSLKRATFAILAVVSVLYFFKFIPIDFQQPSQSFRIHSNTAQLEDILGEPAPVGGKQLLPGEFNGPIKYYHLASTLHDIHGGKEKINENVLFAAAGLHSAATLLPIACEMAETNRSNVHFAIMGRENTSLNIIKSVNGIGKECNVIFHDARPDFTTSSSEFRMQVSVSAAFKHINTLMNPQATLIDASETEELWFLEGIRSQALDLSRTVIEIPKDAEENMRWITVLDSSSLRAWNEVSLEILIHPHSSATGSLIRLLESLKNADFFSSAPPHVTIELPHNIEEPTARYLQSFKWPPTSSRTQGNMLTLHHRISQHNLTPEENSIRMLESFWPANPFSAQILILTPQVELSPFFFHYLKYSILKYKFGQKKSARQDMLLGISLDLPSKYLNDTTKFTLLTAKDKINLKSFLWQAPNSNACLFFGQKWIELHDFVARSLNSQHVLPKPPSLKKEISKAYPSWLEYILQLSRARGYFTLYPNVKDRDSLVISHNDLHHAPEEYKSDLDEGKETLNGDVTINQDKSLSSEHEEIPLLKNTILQGYGELAELEDLQLLSWEGNSLEILESDERALEYRKRFIKEIGGCIDETPKAAMEFSAGDLFCLEDEKYSPADVRKHAAEHEQEFDTGISSDS
ncbi:hypothetical protein K3495_g8433 [Podosphaera aphanis]|nr:hypothetical protein K3495_g8433 [Podosphaera aphanis]